MSASSFNLLYLVPIVCGALLLLALALWCIPALRRRRAAKADALADAYADAHPAGDPGGRPHRSSSTGGCASMAVTDSQRTASPLFMGSSRGPRASPANPQLPSSAHDYGLPSADADALYAALEKDAALAGRRVAFAKIAFDASSSRRRAASPARRVWLCQYEGDEMDVTQLAPVPPASASARESATSPRSLPASSSSASPSPDGWDADGVGLWVLPQLEQFVREIRLVAALRHPHVVAFVGVAWSSLSTLGLVTEHTPHGDLRLFLARHRRAADVPWRPRKLRMALGVARALAYLHARSVFFRGLRTSRVGLTAALEPVLVDFSAAAAGADGGDQSAAETLAAGGGDAFWLAPEVLRGSPDLGLGPADVYALGVLLCELDAGGRAPFHRELGPTRRPFQLLHAVADGSLRPALRAPDCPAAVRTLAAACMAQEPGDRPSAAQVCDILADADKQPEKEAEPAVWTPSRIV